MERSVITIGYIPIIYPRKVRGTQTSVLCMLGTCKISRNHALLLLKGWLSDALYAPLDCVCIVRTSLASPSIFCGMLPATTTCWCLMRQKRLERSHLHPASVIGFGHVFHALLGSLTNGATRHAEKIRFTSCCMYGSSYSCNFGA